MRDLRGCRSRAARRCRRWGGRSARGRCGRSAVCVRPARRSWHGRGGGSAHRLPPPPPRRLVFAGAKPRALGAHAPRVGARRPRCGSGRARCVRAASARAGFKDAGASRARRIPLFTKFMRRAAAGRASVKHGSAAVGLHSSQRALRCTSATPLFELWRLRLGFAALWACAARELKAVLSAGPIELSGRFLGRSYLHWAAPRVCRRRRVHLVRIHPPTRRYDTCKPRVKPKPPAKDVKESSETALIAF